MQNNIYIYLILGCLGVGGGLFYIGYDYIDQAHVKVKLLDAEIEDLEKKRADRDAKRSEASALRLQRLGAQGQARDVAESIIEQSKLIKDHKKRRDEIIQRLALQEFKKTSTQGLLGEIEAQLQEDNMLVERDKESVLAGFEQNLKRLKLKKDGLVEEDKLSTRTSDKKLAELKTELSAIEFRLRRNNNLAPLELDSPWVVGEVLDVLAKDNKVVLSVGEDFGVKPNFKFRVFSGGHASIREYKGFVVVKEVFPLVSMGVMEMVQDDVGSAPVPGDSIGSLVFRKDRLKFYLAGDFSSKYSKGEIVRHLQYAGNEVLQDLTSEVDFFVQGALADNEIPSATALGVSIIPEDHISAYFGE